MPTAEQTTTETTQTAETATAATATMGTTAGAAETTANAEAPKTAEATAEATATETGKGADTTAAATAGAESTEQANTEPPAQKAETKPFWPDDWRQQLAKDAGLDEKAAKRLDRFTSPADVFKALRATESKQAELTKKLPENPTEEELKSWRKDNGIPDTPDGYDVTLADGLVIGEGDKPIVEGFLKDMHGVNASPAAVKGALTSYVKAQQHLAQELERMDVEFKDKSEEDLRAEWGGEYKKNLNLVSGLLDTAPKGFKDQFLNGRLANGNRIADDPAAQRFLVGLAREVNPVPTLLPGAGEDHGVAITNRIAEIKKLMRDFGSDYYKGPKEKNGETKLSNEYRDLQTLQERLKGKGKAA